MHNAGLLLSLQCTHDVVSFKIMTCPFRWLFTASGQGGGAQQHSLKVLGWTSNGTLVENSRCTTNETTTDLFCNFTDSKVLIVNCDTNVALQNIKFQICLCDSAMTVEYTLTNGTVIKRKCNQCPIPVRIGRLLLENDFDVYLDGNNITRIAVLVSVL